ncbi:MAG: GNAT family N-acetyltransferase [Planctomycetaceae bacterium]|nr:GNAT family N-acetyltransferase [Planctomycetaceae bacterium]
MAADQPLPHRPDPTPPAEARPWVISEVPPERTRALRRRVLGGGRRGRYLDDAGPDGAHFGAFDGAGRLLGSAAVHPEPCPGDGATGTDDLWRLRAMAVEPEWRGRGLGKELVRAALAHAEPRGATGLWCHALESARGFYLALGFVDAGEPFAPPGAALHRTMFRRTVFRRVSAVRPG